MKKRRWHLSLLVVLLLGGCYTVPETGRSSFIIPLRDDVAMGASAFAEVKAKEKISDDPVANERVRRIGKRVSRVNR